MAAGRTTSCGAGSPPRRRVGRFRVRLGAAWLGVAGALAFAVAVSAGGAQARPSGCSTPSRLAGGPRGGELLLKQSDNDPVALHFDDSRLKRVYPLRLSADAGRLLPSDFAGPAPLIVKTGDSSIRKDAEHWISLSPSDGLSATLLPLGPRELELCLVLDPSKTSGLVAGRYEGSLLVTRLDTVHGTEGRTLVTIPVSLSFRESRWLGLGITFGAVALGLLVKILSDAAARQRETHGRAWPTLKGYCCELSFPAMLILACVAGALVFNQMYSGNAQWGSASGDAAKLFAVCFLAQMSGNQGIDIIRRVAGTSPSASTSAATQ